MSSYTYYLSNEPPRRRLPWWGWALLALLLGAGAAAAAATAYPRAAGMLWAPASAPAWHADIAAATDPVADTVYLVDLSDSMRDELDNVKQGLRASLAAKAPDSRVGIIAFGDTCAAIAPRPQLRPETAEQAVSSIGTGMDDKETDDRCTLEQTLSELKTALAPEQPTEVFLFSDGSLDSLIAPECAGGSPVPSGKDLDGKPLFRCSAGRWDYQPRPIIAEFRTANIKINGIYFQPHRYDWADQVELLTTATGGEFVRVR